MQNGGKSCGPKRSALRNCWMKLGKRMRRPSMICSRSSGNRCGARGNVAFEPQVAGRGEPSDFGKRVCFAAHGGLSKYQKPRRMPSHLGLRNMAQDRIIDTYRGQREAARRSIDHEQPQRPPAWAAE